MHDLFCVEVASVQHQTILVLKKKIGDFVCKPVEKNKDTKHIKTRILEAHETLFKSYTSAGALAN